MDIKVFGGFERHDVTCRCSRPDGSETRSLAGKLDSVLEFARKWFVETLLSFNRWHTFGLNDPDFGALSGK